MRAWILTSCLLVATPAWATEPGAVGKSREERAHGPSIVSGKAEEEVRKAEQAFAKAFADRDQAAFFAFVLEDAHFLGPRRTLSGREQVRQVWSNFFADKVAPFSWAPERVHSNGAGDLVLSMGPITSKDGQPMGQYVSIWRRQKDGTWKVAFDGPGMPPPCPVTPEDAAPKQKP